MYEQNSWCVCFLFACTYLPNFEKVAAEHTTVPTYLQSCGNSLPVPFCCCFCYLWSFFCLFFSPRLAGWRAGCVDLLFWRVGWLGVAGFWYLGRYRYGVGMVPRYSVHMRVMAVMESSSSSRSSGNHGRFLLSLPCHVVSK